MPPTMASSLQHLPLDVLRTVLLYVSHPADLLSCERTCRDLREAAADDAVWECRLPEWVGGWTILGVDATLGTAGQSETPTRREYACTVHSIGNMRRAQRKSRTRPQVILDVLGADEWTDLIRESLDVFLPDDLVSCHYYRIRGDTSAVLMELVEAGLVENFRRANLIACGTAAMTGRRSGGDDDGKGTGAGAGADVPASSSSSYPRVTAALLRLQDAVSTPPDAQNLVVSQDEAMDYDIAADLLPDREVRERIVRRLAYRAGVVRLSNDAYGVAWATLVRLIVLLLRPACVELVEMMTVRQRGTERVALGPYHTMREVAPPSAFEQCACGEDHGYWVHTPVPRQVEDAARAYSIPHRVYGNEWHATGDCDDSEAAAQEGYAEDEEDGDDDSGSNGGAGGRNNAYASDEELYLYAQPDGEAEEIDGACVTSSVASSPIDDPDNSSDDESVEDSGSSSDSDTGCSSTRSDETVEGSDSPSDIGAGNSADMDPSGGGSSDCGGDEEEDGNEADTESIADSDLGGSGAMHGVEPEILIVSDGMGEPAKKKRRLVYDRTFDASSFCVIS